jgi:hypothetical protein
LSGCSDFAMISLSRHATVKHPNLSFEPVVKSEHPDKQQHNDDDSDNTQSLSCMARRVLAQESIPQEALSDNP